MNEIDEAAENLRNRLTGVFLQSSPQPPLPIAELNAAGLLQAIDTLIDAKIAHLHVKRERD